MRASAAAFTPSFAPPPPPSTPPPTPTTDGARAYPSDNVVSIDVECVATGVTHNDREVAQIAIVNAVDEKVLLNVFVRPRSSVVSYMTPLTGITRETLEAEAVSFDDALAMVRRALPTDAVVVGQGVLKDVQEWLKLERGVDYGDLIDLTGIWRVWNERYKSWSVFSQDHLVRCLLDDTEVNASHDAAGDCVKSVRLYRLFLKLKDDAAGLASAHAKLLATPPEPSFSKRFPSYEGVCQGNRKTCACGAPFFS
jgi:hypothetical protein